MIKKLKNIFIANKNPGHWNQFVDQHLNYVFNLCYKIFSSKEFALNETREIMQTLKNDRIFNRKLPLKIDKSSEFDLLIRDMLLRKFIEQIKNEDKETL